MVEPSNPSNSESASASAQSAAAAGPGHSTANRPRTPLVIAAVAMLALLAIGAVAYSLSDGGRIRHTAGYRANPEQPGASSTSDGAAAASSKHPLAPALELADEV